MSEQDDSARDESDDPTSILNESVMSVLDAMTIQLNEIYESLKRAGFTPPEAITMVTGMLSNMIQYSPMSSVIDDDDEHNHNDYNDYNNDEDDDDWNGPQDRY